MSDKVSEDTPAAQSTSVSKSAGSAQMEGIQHPGINDVMFGRGGDTNYHIGNHRFRVLADKYRKEYRSSTRKEKALVVQEVVRCWRAEGGRFLAKTDPEKGDASLWHDVGDVAAKKKAAKILSEKAPQEKNQKDDQANSRKRPAVDTPEFQRAPKAASLPPTGAQPFPAMAMAAATSVSLSSTSDMARSLLQPTAPAPNPVGLPSRASPADSQPRLQLPPRDHQLANLIAQLAGSQATNLSVQDLLGLYRDRPLALSALDGTAGLPPHDDIVTATLLAQAIIQREDAAARARLLLANNLLANNLRSLAVNQLLGPAGAIINTGSNSLVNAARLGLSSDQLRMIVSRVALLEEQKTNEDTNSRDERRVSDPS